MPLPATQAAWPRTLRPYTSPSRCLLLDALAALTLPPPLPSNPHPLQPGFGFITFEDERDADDAVAGLDGKNGWKVERARPSRREGGGFGGRGGGGYGGGGVSWKPQGPA